MGRGEDHLPRSLRRLPPLSCTGKPPAIFRGKSLVSPKIPNPPPSRPGRPTQPPENPQKRHHQTPLAPSSSSPPTTKVQPFVISLDNPDLPPAPHPNRPELLPRRRAKEAFRAMILGCVSAWRARTRKMDEGDAGCIGEEICRCPRPPRRNPKGAVSRRAGHSRGPERLLSHHSRF